MTSIVFENSDFNSTNASNNRINDFINEFVSMLPEGVELDVSNIGKSLSPAVIFGEILSMIRGEGIRDVVIMLLFSVFIIFLSSLYETRLTPMIEIGAGMAFLAGTTNSLYTLTDEVCRSLDKMSSFFASLTPLLVSVSVFGGGSNTAISSSMQMTLTASVLELISSRLLLPLISAMLVLGVLSTLGGSAIPRIQKTIRDIFTKALGLISVVSGILFTLQSVLASASDSAALRLAKFTAQSVAPSVGTVISSSMSTLASGVGYAKSIIGAGAVYAVISVMLSPLPQLVLYRFAIGICQSFAEIMETKTFARGLSGLRYALDALVSVYLIFGALFILQLILFVRSGASLS